ncbi:hypothetical protein B0H67DRAFT_648324 [Lasiosphaeris hirsuta]|uniref:3-keto-steroid reductase n=1 Tax=Lasiosphaeris hirsuta TaxID=260670 RepID=A0AA40A2T0_9PEZI|nr:hypothetical protein B0H67DRAFT_648324 [Lasiosphaeris hirsuta]
MAPAPWDGVPSHETQFVLVTGANSGIGYGIGERLIDEFLLTRSLSAHLIVIPTTRTTKKSRETVEGLQRHAKEFAETSDILRSRAGPDYNPKDTTRRVHILSVQLDLCDFLTIRDVANELIRGTLTGPVGSNAEDGDFFAPLVDVKIPRLDSVVFNAGIGGWTGLDWGKFAHNVLTKGLIQATTWPTFKASIGGHVVNPLAKSPKADKGAAVLLGEVFCANVLGHHLLAHALLPLLHRPVDSDLPAGRIIWESSVEPVWDCLSLADFQAIKTPAAYENSKRMTDVLCLSSSLPATQPYVKTYLRNPASPTTPTIPPKIYLTHPGVVQTTLFPVNAFLFFWYRVALYLIRWLGSPWHVVTTYAGACAPVWLALQQQGALDAAQAERVKWGSANDRAGNCRVKKTEVEGWGWEGRVEGPDSAKGVLRRGVGRKSGAPDLTPERLVEFEALGAEVWRELERLRIEWEDRIARA